ncbi:hypothetical protein SVA_0852 [Sulfurifustis variabilis]|uniref:EF-hand domain-containing protein n=1 Tax=Sulfurifustis variabilis TaxID=1675686 RepID=A0A1B4VB07_9GAMM|nr:EF-hand domain-containing protein [Sulfurifustis variabilis]BAU47431.1 hypothetical protein SVA_0852 [Sulfurifustis variabilis]
MKPALPALAILALSAAPFAALAAEDPARSPAPPEQTGVPQNLPPGGTETRGSGGTAEGVIPEMPAFSMVDANNSGYVEQDEAATVEEVDFLAADSDKDGRLTRSEYEAALKGAGMKKKGEATTR